MDNEKQKRLVDLLDTFFDDIGYGEAIDVLAMYDRAAVKFIDKVDDGRARSVETYKELSTALAASNKLKRNIAAILSSVFPEIQQAYDAHNGKEDLHNWVG